MKTEMIEQYAHTWRTFAGIVQNFDDDAWLHTGKGIVIPVHIAFHILKATTYYLEAVSFE